MTRTHFLPAAAFVNTATPTAGCGSRSERRNKVAMSMDEDDQESHFFFNYPERGSYFAA